MSIRFTLQSAALLALLVAAPAFTATRIADALTGSDIAVAATPTETVPTIEGHTLGEVVVVANRYDAPAENIAARPAARTTRPA